MNKKMMEILACPIDKHHPLEIFEIETKDEIVMEGALFCTDCSRFYPIIDEIPIMLPDELREKELEMEEVLKDLFKSSYGEFLLKFGGTEELISVLDT